MADDVQTLGFDFSKDLAQFTKLVQSLEKYNLKIKEVTDAQIKYNGAGEAQTAVLKLITESGQKASIAIGELRDAQGKFRSATDRATVSLQNQAKELDNVTQAEKRALLEIKNLIAQGEETREEFRRENLLKSQQAVFDNVRNESKAQNEITTIFAEGERTKEQIRRQGVLANQEASLRALKDTASAQRQINDIFLQGQALKERILLQNRQSVLEDQAATYKGLRSSSGQIKDIFVQGDIAKEQARRQSIISDQQVLYNKLLKESGDGVTRLSSTTKDATSSMILSWQSLIRLLQIQVLHNIFGGLISQLHEGAQAAVQLSIKIGEIQTISQDAQLTTQQWLTGIRNLSDAYGKDLKDVAEGVYETLSNQAAKGQDAIQFLNTALKFSITTVSSVSDSVNLLTAAMNSYGVGQEKAERIAAEFFKTIDLGRVRASELANTIGRVLPTASRLGVGLEEVNAAIATLTVSGIKYNEAFTLIQNVLLKLLKPSEAMVKTFKEWGVAGGEAALAAFGFGGTLKKLEEAAGGSDEELAQMFINIRAIRGELGLTGSAFSTYTNNLEKIKKSTSEYSNAFKLVEESSGKKLSDEFNKIKNIFTVDFGTQLINELTVLNSSLGGFANRIKDIVQIGKVAIETYAFYRIGSWLFTGLSAHAVALRAVGNAALGNLATSRAELALAKQLTIQRLSQTGASTLAVVAISALTYAYEKHQQEITKMQNLEAELQGKFSETTQTFITQRQAILENSARIEEEASSRLFSALIQQSAGANRVINTLLENQKEKLKENLDVFKSGLETYVKLQQDALEKTRSEEKKLQTEIERSLQRQSEYKDKSTDAAFDLKFSEAKTDPVKQIALLTERFKELKIQINEAFASGNVDLALKRYNEANEIIGKVASLQAALNQQIETSKDKLQDQQANNELATQIRAIQEQIKLQKGNRSALQQQLDSLRARLAAQRASQGIENNEKTLEEAQKALDQLKQNFGENITKSFADAMIDAEKQFVKSAQEEQKKLTDQRIQDETRIILLRKSLNQIGDFNIFNKSGTLKYKTVEDAQKELDRLIGQAEKAGLEKDSDQYKQVWEQRKQIAIEAQEEILSAQSRKLQETLVQQKDQLKNVINDAQKLQEEAIKKQAEALKNFQVKAGLANGALNFNYYGSGLAGKVTSSNLESLSKYLVGENSELGDLGSIGQDLKNFAKLQEALKLEDPKNLANIEAISQEIGQLSVKLNKELTELQNTLGKDPKLANFYGGILKNLNENPTGLPGNKSVADTISEAAVAYQNYLKTVESSESAQKQISQLNSELLALSTQIAGLPGITAPATESIKTNFDSVKKSIIETTEEIKKMNNEVFKFKIQQLLQDTVIPNTLNHFASGGLIGADSVISATSPGEFILNKNAVSNFFPQILAMNSTRPQHASGGISFGNINITNSSSGNAGTDARALVRALKSEIRRGTLAF